MKSQSTRRNKFIWTSLVFSFMLTLLTIDSAQAQQWTNSSGDPNNINNTNSGKALESLAKGQGEILVLLSLQ